MGAPSHRASIAVESSPALPRIALRGYYVAFFLYVSLAAVSHSTLIELPLYSTIEPVVQLVILLLMALKLLTQVYDAKRLVVTVLLLGFALVVWRTSAEGLFFWLSLFALSSQGVHFDSLAKTALYATVTSIALVVLMYSLGYIEGVVISRGDGTARWSLGFNHPNILALYLLRITILLAVIQWNQSPVAATVFTLFFAPAVSMICDSRTSVAMMIAAVVIAWAIDLFRRFGKNEKWKTIFCIATLLTLACAAICSLAIMVIYDPSIPGMESLSDALSGRPYYANLYYEEHTPGLLGYGYPDGPMFFTGYYEKNFLVDNSYCSMFLRWGILASILVLLGCALVVLRAARERYWSAFIYGLLIFGIYGLTETYFLAIDSNIFLVFLGTLIHKGGFSAFDGGLPATEEGVFMPYQVLCKHLKVDA